MLVLQWYSTLIAEQLKSGCNVKNIGDKGKLNTPLYAVEDGDLPM
jgi:hypothetical protein